MGKIIVDVMAAEVDKELNVKSKVSLKVGELATPEKKAIDTKEEEIKKKIASMEETENITFNDNGNITIEVEEQEIEGKDEKDEKTIEDSGDDLIV